jgi:hypothetical protein
MRLLIVCHFPVAGGHDSLAQLQLSIKALERLNSAPISPNRDSVKNSLLNLRFHRIISHDG